MLLYTIVTAFDTINISSLVDKESQKGLKKKEEEDWKLQKLKESSQ